MGVQSYDVSDKLDVVKNEIHNNNNCYRIWKTICVIVVWIELGMVNSVASPTLPDFRDRLKTNMEDLQLALGFGNFGGLVGSILTSMLADRYSSKGDLVFGLSVILTGFPAIIKPHCRSLITVGGLSFLGGIGTAGRESVGHAIIIWMWGDKAGPFFHAIHMGYPIGSTLAPLIAMPFLGPDREDEVNHTTTGLTTYTDIWDTEINNTLSNISSITPFTQSVTAEPEKVSRIEIPFAIAGGLMCLSGVIFLVFQIVGPPKGMKFHIQEKSSFLEVLNPRSCRGTGSTGYTCALLILICLYYSLLLTKDRTLDNFMFSFAVESELKLSKREASIFDTVIRSMEIVGRVIAVLVSYWAPIQPMIIIEVISNAAVIACLAFLGTRSKTYLYVFGCLFNLTGAPIWPGGMTWISKYVSFSSMIVAVTQIVISLSGYPLTWLGGYFYDNYADDAFIFYSMACGFVLVLVVIIMQIVASCCHQKEDPEVILKEMDVDKTSHVNTASDFTKF